MEKISMKQFHRLTDLAGQDDAQRTYESMAAFEAYANEIQWPFRATGEQSEYWALLAKNWGRA